MPFFEKAQRVTIIESQMHDIKGNFYKYDYSSRVNNRDSNNTNTSNTTDSYNDSSTTETGDQNIPNYHADRRTISGLVLTSIHGNSRPSRNKGGRHYAQQRRDADTTHSAEEPQFHYQEGGEEDRYQQGPEIARFLEQARRDHDKIARSQPDNYDMDVDPQREKVLSQSTYPSPSQPSLNPFYSQPLPSFPQPPYPTADPARYMSKSNPTLAVPSPQGPQPTFDEFCDHAGSGDTGRR